MRGKKKKNQMEHLDNNDFQLIHNSVFLHLNKKVGGVVLTVFLSIILLVVVIFPSSYALFKGAKEVNGSVFVPDNDYCMNNGFTKLSDCILVTENYAKSVSDAKNYITTKGTPDFSKMAPTVVYKETTATVTDANGILSTTSHFTLGRGYTFNASTGIFTLTDYIDDGLSDAYINYYTCGATTVTAASCSTMYQIKAYENVTTGSTVTYKVTSAIRHNYSTVDSIDSEVGLYSTLDDDGTSYYYRGNVKNNYVSYAGYIWRIIRENGNGTVRMIYSGTSTKDTLDATSIGTSQFNFKYWDPTYAGYKYHENFALNTTGNSDAPYVDFRENVSYYFGQNYTFDTTTRRFKLTGSVISGKWNDVYQKAISSYPYTCFSTSVSGTCDVLKKVMGYSNASTATVHLISNSSKDYNSTLLNTIDSPIKTTLENWYVTNILNKKDTTGRSYASYLSDEIYCNDRSVTDGSGYLLSPSTYYGPYNRIIAQRVPSLKCKQQADKFTVSTIKGNTTLKYPIGLITLDEASMAGGVLNAVNTQYYLYTGQSYWTMSPSSVGSWDASVHAGYVSSTGTISELRLFFELGARPVINLSSNVLISNGNGTVERPYTVKLN